MPPTNARDILVKMDDQDVIDIFRIVEAQAQKAGQDSLVPLLAVDHAGRQGSRLAAQDGEEYGRLRVKAAAQTALHTRRDKDSEDGKAPLRGVRASAALRSAGSTPSRSPASAQPGAFRCSKRFQKALAAGSARGTAGSSAALHGSAGHGGTALGGEAGAAHGASRCSGVEARRQAAGKGDEHAEAGKAARRKALHALPHGTAAEAGVPSALAGELLKDWKMRTRSAKGRRGLGDGTRERRGARRGAQRPRKHGSMSSICEHKPAEQAADESLLAVKPPRLASSDRMPRSPSSRSSDGGSEPLGGRSSKTSVHQLRAPSRARSSVCARWRAPSW